MGRAFPAARLRWRTYLVPAVILLASCSAETPEPQAEETEIPPELQQAPAAPTAGQAVDAASGTPMAERVATIGLLNKRNNVSQDLTMKPGESRRIGNVIVRLSACERTPIWELPNEAGAFVQLLVRDTGGEQAWRKAFSGWLFKRSPSLNVVEHPIYDVWVKDCAMSFPGEEKPSVSGDTGPSAPASAAAPTPASSPAPEPAPEPAAEPDSNDE
jgi:hypothetical protein